MKLAVLGAPGSGKTPFADDLTQLLEDPDNPFYMIDDYVRDLQVTGGLEYGLFGSHVDDMQVVFKRREYELVVDAEHSSITCGTVLDSTAHCFARAEDAARNRREVGIQAERLRTIAGTFGLLYTETWDYDYAFYLPYTGDDPYSRLLDQSLREILRTYAPPVLSFKPEVSDEEKARTAARAITAFEEKQLQETPERGVRSSGEVGKDDGDSTEPVSDVPEQGRAPEDA